MPNMPPTDHISDEDAPVDATDLLEVGRYASLEQAHEHGLVVLAMRQACMVVPAETPGQYALHAEPEHARAVARELAAYENEKEPAAAPGLDVRTAFSHPAGWEAYLIWLLAVVGGFMWQQNDPTLVDRAASSSRALLANHEWWRPFTGLFLHADMPHLMGNLLCGLIFGTMASRLIGPWLGWALILVCGTLGNLATSLVTWPESFVSIGASCRASGSKPCCGTGCVCHGCASPRRCLRVWFC
jgi:rhomboid protease GluP